MALDIIPKQEDGKLKAVASGTLPSGKPVVVNSDGTVSVVGSTSVSTSFGSDTVFEAASANYLSSTYHPTENKVVIFYKDGGNSNKGTYIVGTVSGSSISFGTAAAFSTSGIENISSTYDTAANKIVVCYTDLGNSNYGTAVVGTLSGTTMSFGSAVVFSSSYFINNAMAYDSVAGKIAIAYRDHGNSGYGTGIVGTVSGTSISFGSPTIFSNTGAAVIHGAAYDTNAGKVVVSFSDSGVPYTGKGTAVVGTISGTSISFGSKVIFDNAGAANYTVIAYDSNAQKVVISYSDTGDSYKGKAIVGTVSGTSISFGTAVTYESGATGPQAIIYSPNVGRLVIFYRDNANSNERSAIVGTVSGTSITFDTKENFGASRSDYYATAYDEASGKIVLAYEDQGNSFHGYAIVMTVGGEIPNLTSENYIGMSGGLVDVETVTQALGSVVDITNTAPAYIAMAHDESAGKVIVAYKLDGGNEYGYAAVGTVSGTSITFGTPVAYTSSALQSASQSIAYDSVNNKVVISFTLQGGGNRYGTAIVGTVSGDSISFGSAVTFNAGVTAWITSVFDSSNNKVVISYSDGGNSDYGTAIVGTVSGTSISFGSEVVFESANSGYLGSTFDSTNNKVVVSYRDDGNTGKGTAIVGTVSGTSISFGTAALFNNASTYWTDATFDSTNGKAVILYMDDGNSQYGTAIVGTVSGTDITFGSEVVFSTASTKAPVAAFDSAVGKVTVAYRDAGNSNNTTIIPATVSGTSISFDSAVDVGIVNGGGESIGIVFDSTNNRNVIAFKDDTANDNSAVVFRNAGTITTRGSVADGDNATVDIVGTVSSNQVSLTAGQQYYVQADGTIGTTPANPSVLAGTAVSATKLLVKT